MTERYEPPSDFLRAVINDEAPLVGSGFAKANLCRLIAMTRDEHPANRDWATMLLSQQEIDTPEVRDALMTAADDENDFVRAEAILGVAQRDRAAALPLLQRELAREFVALAIFEAASLVADASLVEELRRFTSLSEHAHLDGAALDALKACETEQPI